MTTSHVTLAGSKHPQQDSIRRLRDVEADRHIVVTITLRGPDLSDPNTLPSQGLTPETFAAQYGAQPGDLETVIQDLENFGLAVESRSPSTRSLRMSGTAAAMNAAFKANLGIYRHPQQGEILAHEEHLAVPAELSGIITGVFGLDQRAVVRRLPGRRSAQAGPPAAQTAVASLQASPLTPGDLENHYDFPQGDGAGQSIAIAEFGGHYSPTLLQAFSAQFQRPAPNIKVVHASTMPPEAPEEDVDISGEVMLDAEIIAGLCPTAQITMYFSTMDEQGFVDLLNQVITDRPVALSISWGNAEETGVAGQGWSPAGMQAINERLGAAARLGITVCVSSGDDGTSDNLFDGQCHVNFPASSPFVLSVGGTMGDSSGSEVTWWVSPGARFGRDRESLPGGATGGGVSTQFPRPSWQDVQIESLNPGALQGRVLPDVAALAGAPDYMVFLPQLQGDEVIGSWMGCGGTSAAAPLWAALIARVNALLPEGKRQRFLTPLLYQAGPDGRPLGQSVCNDITEGNNATTYTPAPGYQAGPGYDAVTGWGTPIGTALLKALASLD